ncbi:PIG-L family deacetylase [Paenibacillus melissococcoides]|uniref:PIG-L family deacetylase n=1 Tax=Paenibacillus melissococcoides TaxID=2912268 RepID=A0ABN8TZ24_9BACL|nr:PIG-L family deacetylase [Bacillus cereus]CAH8244005.1 PIG-L family deacetylase [Paenibacillus melissococcoides]CAH8704046.1 PIG-L family deacetylase [Paenibacillus melissococcoides]CAH8706728.1 PIG-L family deacetylase [Paenibacillus melissococcoides]
MTHTVGFIYAHPDDETFGCACLIRSLADQGVSAALLTATSGEAGKTGRLGPMSREELAARRERELAAAGAIMGLADIELLRYPDGQLSSVPRSEVVAKIAAFLNRHRIEVVVTFPEDGISGHPDHIAIHHAVNEAVWSGSCPHVQKLYYNMPLTVPEAEADSVIRLEVAPYWEMKAAALRAHESQILSIERVFGDLQTVPADERMREEAFALVWKRGVHRPAIREHSVLDDLHKDS